MGKSVVKILKFLSVRGVEKNLAQLKSAGKIRRIGGRKGDRWEVGFRRGQNPRKVRFSRGLRSEAAAPRQLCGVLGISLVP